MPSVDEHGKLHRPGAPVLADGVERGPHRATGEQHIVYEHHGGAPQVDGDVGPPGRDDGPQPDVVPIHRDVEAPDRHRPFDAGDLDAETLGQPHAAALQPEQHQRVESAVTGVAFEDLVRHAGDGPPHVILAEHQARGSRRSLGFVAHTSSVRASQDPLHGRIATVTAPVGT